MIVPVHCITALYQAIFPRVYLHDRELLTLGFPRILTEDSPAEIPCVVGGDTHPRFQECLALGVARRTILIPGWFCLGWLGYTCLLLLSIVFALVTQYYVTRCLYANVMKM